MLTFLRQNILPFYPVTACVEPVEAIRPDDFLASQCAADALLVNH
jgi:hypothetical protein